MKITLLIFSLLISFPSLSQKNEIEFGEISSKEFKMTSYEKDTTAKAVVLFDKGESIFFDTEKGYDIRFTRHKRIKIFDKNETQYSEISIPFYVDGFGKTEVIKSIEAFTYNSENGKVIQKKVNPSTIYEEQINERWLNKKFVFPDVQDGAVLELKYVLETPFHFNLPDWTFQDKIPTLYSEYEVRMIPFYEYTFLVQGISEFDYHNSVVAKEHRTWGNSIKTYGVNVGGGIEFQDNVHTYVLRDIPAFKDESYISSINDYIVKMDFQLAKFYNPQGGNYDIISTWPDLNETLLKHEEFGKYLNKGERLAKKIIEEDLELAGLTKHQKAIKIIEYVKNNYEWNNHYSKYSSQSVKDFINKKNGNAADINLLLISLLNAADIETQPVIISTRDHGKISLDYPFDHFTNYVIALVNTNAPFLADGTEELLPYNRLPIRCINEAGLIVNENDKVQWLRLGNSISSLEKNTVILQLDSFTLDAKARVSIQSTEYESFENRSRFRDDTLKIKEYYADKIGSINSTSTIGYKNRSFPYSINLVGNHETEKLGENIIIRPFLNLPVSQNHLKQAKRTYPVDFVYAWNNQFESTLKIPEGFTITDLPEPYQMNNDLAEINLNYTISDGILTTKGNYRFKKAVYVASEYPRIKDYMDRIVKIFNQPIMLERSSNPG